MLPVNSPALADLSVRHFRCLETASLSFDPQLNVIVGGNGSGKTSLLEAIFFLGRGRSFRAADNRVLIQRGQEAAEIVGSLRGPSRLGIRIASGGLEIHMDGRAGASTAELASSCPVEALHADIGSVIQGPPEVRRRLLDWGLFHVEHQFLPRWRDYRRALMQRIAALRTCSPDALLDAWDAKLIEAGAPRTCGS